MPLPTIATGRTLLAAPLPAVFSPLSLTGLKLWLKADAGTWQDSTGNTTQATADGDVVGYWGDQSGNGVNPTQATTSKKPLLKLAQQNGRPILLTDGVDDNLSTSLGVALGTAYSIFIVTKLLAGGSGSKMVLDIRGTGSSVLALRGGSSDWFNRYDNAGAPSPQPALSLGSSTVLAELVNNSGALTTYKNSVQQATGSISGNGVLGTGPFALSIQQTDLLSSPAQLWLGEVLVYASALSDANRASVEAYLNGRWAVY